jgi:hypothetical protein
MSKTKRGRPKNPPKFKELLQQYVPTTDIFTTDELKMYEGLVDIYLQDFDEEHLTAIDMDDIMSIALNKVLETRLLKLGKENMGNQVDASKAIESLRKQTEKFKENLATRRKDRIDPKKFSGFSIVDLAAAFDKDKRDKVMEKIDRMRKEEDELLSSELLIGNKDDEDAEIIEEEDA